MVLPPASAVIIAFMAVGFLTLKSPYGIRGALGRYLCVLTAQQAPAEQETLPAGIHPGLPRAPVAPLWAALKQSEGLRQTSMF